MTMVGTKVVIEIRGPMLRRTIEAAEMIAAWVRSTTGLVFDTKVNIYSLDDDDGGQNLIEPEDSQ